MVSCVFLKHVLTRLKSRQYLRLVFDLIMGLAAFLVHLFLCCLSTSWSTGKSADEASNMTTQGQFCFDGFHENKYLCHTVPMCAHANDSRSRYTSKISKNLKYKPPCSIMTDICHEATRSTTAKKRTPSEAAPGTQPQHSRLPWSTPSSYLYY